MCEFVFLVNEVFDAVTRGNIIPFCYFNCKNVILISNVKKNVVLKEVLFD